MPRRRDFGSVRKLPSGRYQASYWHEGRRHTADHTFTGKADGTRWLSTVEASIIRNEWIDPVAGKVPVSAYASEWIAKRADLRPTTKGKYGSLLRLHIEPVMGRKEMAKLSPSAVRNWYHKLAESHPARADDAYRFLRAVCNTAVTDGVIGKNPCQVRGAGQVRSAERPVASIAEATAGANAMPKRFALGVLLAAWCQLRRGEVLGLQRRDVDPLHGTIRVERSWTVLPDGEPVLGPPKTDAGRRTLTVPGHLLPALKKHLKTFVAAPPDAWLFPTSTGTVVSPRNFERAWSQARESIKRPDLHFHDLRHSGLTWAAATGASIAELMRRGGHANPRAALKYQHATEDRDKALAHALSGLASASLAHVARTSASSAKKAPMRKGA